MYSLYHHLGFKCIVSLYLFAEFQSRNAYREAKIAKFQSRNAYREEKLKLLNQPKHYNYKLTI